MRRLKLAPLMKIVGLAADELFVCKRPDFSCFNQDDIIGILHFTFNQEEILLSNDEPKPLE